MLTHKLGNNLIFRHRNECFYQLFLNGVKVETCRRGIKVVHFVMFQDVCSDLVYFELMYKVCKSFTVFTAVLLSIPIPVGYDSASLGKYPVTQRRIAVQSLK